MKKQNSLVKKQNSLAILAVTLGNVFWGFSFLFSSIALDVANPSILLSHRFILSTILMLIPVLIGKVNISFKGKHFGPILLLIISELVYFLMETYAIKEINSTISGLVLAVVPVITIGSGALFLKEYPTKKQAIFCFLPVAGVILMIISGKEMGVIKPLGIFLLTMMLVFSTIYKTVNRKASQEFNSYERTLLVLGVSALVFSVTGLGSVDWNVKNFFAPLKETSYLLPMLSLSLLCSIGANLLVNYAVGQMSVFKVSSFGAVSTLCTMVGGILFRKDPYDWVLLVGAGLIIVGIWQITRPVPQKEKVKQ